MTQLKGIYTALITPFDHDGCLDTKGLIDNIREQIESGVDGLVLLGTTGETPTLSSAEKNTILEIAKEQIFGKISFVIGTGSNATDVTIQNTLHAKKMGADFALIVTPYYNKPTQKGIYLHFKAIAEAVDIPIILYNHPGRCGVNISTETIIELSKIRNIVGVKEVSGNPFQVSEIIEKTNNFSVLAGDDPFTLPLMAMGGHGIFSVASNLIPQEMVTLVRTLEVQDYTSARKIHHELGPLFRALSLETNPMSIKAAMSMVGLAAGSCRTPLCDMQSENLQKLKIVLEGLQTVAL